MAAQMRVSLRTFDQMRYDGKDMGFPMPTVKWGGRLVRFRPRDVEVWGAEFERKRRAA